MRQGSGRALRLPRLVRGTLLEYGPDAEWGLSGFDAAPEKRVEPVSCCLPPELAAEIYGTLRRREQDATQRDQRRGTSETYDR